MDILLIILGIVCLLIAFAGSILPMLPGPPLAYLALIFLHFTDKVDFTPTQLIVWGLFVAMILILDYITPLLGTKYSGGTQYGNRGCLIGTIAGIFVFPPWGIIIGPFIGAFIGERIGGKKTAAALKAGIGAFIGFLFGIIFKLMACSFFTWQFFTALLK